MKQTPCLFNKRNKEMSKANVTFTVLAGKYEEEGENVKYCNDFLTIEEVIRAIKEKGLRSYHFCRVEKCVDGKVVEEATV